MSKDFKGGNIYPKFTSKNPIAKILMTNYLSSMFRLANGLKFSSVIDVGCGEGEIISVWKKHCPECSIIGVDIDENILQTARERNKNVRFEVQNICRLDIPDNSFDLVLCLEVLEHLENPRQALSELVRISKKYILCSVPREPVWSFLNLCRFAYIRNLGNTPGHIQKWSKKSFTKLLSEFASIKSVNNPLPWTMALGENG